MGDDRASHPVSNKVTFFGSASSNAQLHDGALVSVELIEQESLEGFKVAPYDGIAWGWAWASARQTISGAMPFSRT